MPDQVHDFNAAIIDEFRANGGAVGGMFEGRTMLLLHTVGWRSGTPRTNPLVYRPDGDDGWVVFGSDRGASKDPVWVANLLAEPDVEIEVGTAVVAVRARLAEGAERDALWTAQQGDHPEFAELEVRAAPRQIPVIVLQRR